MKISFSMTDRALEEEATRYGSVPFSRGNGELGTSLLNFFYFDRTSEGEFYDRSRATGEELRPKSTMWLTAVDGSN